MLFVNLLNENNDIGEFERVLHEDVKRLSGRKIFRSTNRTTNTFYKKEIRTDRKPLNTNNVIDAYVEGMRIAKYTKLPSRRQAVFAADKSNHLHVYGTPHYIFPSKRCNVWYSNYDAWSEFFEKAAEYILFGQELEEALRAAKRTKSLKTFLFLRTMDNYWHTRGGPTEPVLTAIAKHYNDIIREEAFELNMQPFKKLRYTFALINMYFKNLKPYNGRQNDAYEITITGNHFYMVDIKWFDSNFVWDKSTNTYRSIQN